MSTESAELEATGGCDTRDEKQARYVPTSKSATSRRQGHMGRRPAQSLANAPIPIFCCAGEIEMDRQVANTEAKYHVTMGDGVTPHVGVAMAFFIGSINTGAPHATILVCCLESSLVRLPRGCE